MTPLVMKLPAMHNTKKPNETAIAILRARSILVSFLFPMCGLKQCEKQIPFGFAQGRLSLRLPRGRRPVLGDPDKRAPFRTTLLRQIGSVVTERLKPTRKA